MLTVVHKMLSLLCCFSSLKLTLEKSPICSRQQVVCILYSDLAWYVTMISRNFYEICSHICCEKWHTCKKCCLLQLRLVLKDWFIWFQERFTQDMQPHYVYSPREMTRWVRGICEALRPLETLSVEGLVRIWAHEALRLFQDRYEYRGRSRISGNGVHMYKGVGSLLCWFYLIFLKYPMKMK